MQMWSSPTKGVSEKRLQVNGDGEGVEVAKLPAIREGPKDRRGRTGESSPRPVPRRGWRGRGANGGDAADGGTRQAAMTA